MFHLFRRLAFSCVLTSLFVAATGCDNDTDVASVRRFFGHNNIRQCRSINISVDLAVANATLAHLEDGSLDCALDESLEAQGCEISFDQTRDGDTLHVLVDGCRVPAETSLFDCGFRKGDMHALSSATYADCDCDGEPVCDWNIFCFESPRICVAAEANPGACEDCFNGVDDDGDGFVDCRDGDCAIVDCGVGQSTVTCPSSTTTFTTTTSLATP